MLVKDTDCTLSNILYYYILYHPQVTQSVAILLNRTDGLVIG